MPPAPGTRRRQAGCSAGASTASLARSIGIHVARRYEDAKPARFAIERMDGGERIRIKARKNWLGLLFLCVWLTGWTAGGVLAMSALTTRFDTFLLAWLCAWALGWAFAATTIAWQLTGAETLRATAGDLEIGWEFAGLGRHRFYRGHEISRLAAGGADDIMARMYWIYPPFLNFSNSGSVRFDYGARTIHAAAGLDRAEGEMIVEHLRRGLPASAVDK